MNEFPENPTPEELIELQRHCNSLWREVIDLEEEMRLAEWQSDDIQEYLSKHGINESVTGFYDVEES